MTTFGSSQDEDPIDPAMVQARKTAIKTATLEGCTIELQVQRQHINTLNDKLEGLQNLYMTLQNQFIQYQQQRAIELSGLVNHGPTSRED